MTAKRLPPALEHYIEDELLRAPMIVDQLLGGISGQSRQQRGSLAKSDRLFGDAVLHQLEQHWPQVSDGYMASLRQQVQEAFRAPPRAAPAEGRKAAGRLVLELVDDDAIALDVELSHAIQAIKDTSEHVLRDLQAYLAAIVGDMDVTEDHNPFHPAVHARALRAAALALPGSLRDQIAFIRLASEPLAQLLRLAYSASCARLQDMGVEPASHRTVLLPDGSRRVQIMPDVTYVPDLQRIRDAMPSGPHRTTSRERVRRLADGDNAAPGRDAPAAARAAAPPSVARLCAPGAAAEAPEATGAGVATDIAERQQADEARQLRDRGTADRQAVELVSRLFRAIATDERVPKDVADLIALLRGPGMRLTLRDPSVLDRREHPLWRFIHVFAYQAEMVPNPDDPERQRWLRFGRETIEKLAAHPMQKAAHFESALDRLEDFLHQRLARRCAALAARMSALQRTEAGLAALRPAEPAGIDRAIEEAPLLDTVPAALMPPQPESRLPEDEERTVAADWLEGLVLGEWVRMLLKGKWVHAQLLWRGERGQILLFGDGASDATWVVRRGVLLRMHVHRLAKTLKVRSLVGTAAMRVQDQLAIADAA